MRARGIAIGVLLAALIGAGRPTAAAPLLTSLETVSGRNVLVETEHALDVRVDGVLAEVRARQKLENRGRDAEEAIYKFTLPAEAALTELTVKLPGGRTAAAMVVTAEAAARVVPDREVKGRPDVALLRMIERRDELTVYELRVYPVDPKAAVEVRFTWVAPLRLDGGRLSLRIPGRGPGGNLAVESVALAVAAPAGAKALGEVAAGGTVLGRGLKGAKAKYKLTAPAEGDLVIEVTPVLRPGTPLVSWTATPLGDAEGALAVAVLAPPARDQDVPRYDRVLFLLDVSRSVGRPGIEAARDVAGAVLGAVGPDARVEAVVFDRTARRVLGGWSPNDRDTRRKLELALAEAPLVNGTDLAGALGLVRPILDERSRAEQADDRAGLSASTLVVLVSDGIAPVALDGNAAAGRLGTDLYERIFLVNITLYPDGAAAPGSAQGAAAELALAAGGRSIVVRDTDAGQRAALLAGELARPAPLRGLTVAIGDAFFTDDIEWPAELAPGQGFFAVRRFAGKTPKELVVTGLSGDAEVRVAAKKGGVPASAVLPLWMAQAHVEDFGPPPPSGDVAAPLDADGEALAQRRYLETAADAGVVTALTALVALDPDDPFSRDRAAFTRKWGPRFYERFPPPPEDAYGDTVTVAAPEVGRARPVLVTTVRPRALTGDLDEGIVRRVVRTTVVPQARACYQRVLRGDPEAAGTIELILELARGEVVAARVGKSTFKIADLDLCVVEAAYQIEVPRVAVGDEPDAVSLVRYPLIFRVVNRTADVSEEPEPQKGPAKDPARGGTPVERDPD